MVDEHDNPLVGRLASIVKINTDEKIEVDSTQYQGESIVVKLKAITPFNQPIYKNVVIGWNKLKSFIKHTGECVLKKTPTQGQQPILNQHKFVDKEASDEASCKESCQKNEECKAYSFYK